MSNAKALRIIAEQMRQPGYCTDDNGIEALCLDNAADEIEHLRESLEYLLDMQNGPPLIEFADEWRAAVYQAYAALGKGK